MFKIGEAVFAAVAIDANLDQLVGVQADLDFVEDCLGEAVLGNRDDGVEGMGLGAQWDGVFYIRDMDAVKMER